MVSKEVSTEQKIKEAAIKVFTRKGKDGARMQDIADEANINKAMLHYYFRNKQKLFEIVFEEKLMELFSTFQIIMDSDLNFEEKIRKFIDIEIDMLSQYPTLPMFVLNEIGKKPEMLEEKYSSKGPKLIKEAFTIMVEKEIVEGNIRKVDPRQLLINLMSMCIYPILAKPVIQMVLDADEKKFADLLQTRKELVADLLLNDLKLN